MELALRRYKNPDDFLLREKLSGADKKDLTGILSSIEPQVVEKAIVEIRKKIGKEKISCGEYLKKVKEYYYGLFSEVICDVEGEVLREKPEFITIREYYESLGKNPLESRVCKMNIEIYGNDYLEKKVPTRVRDIAYSNMEKFEDTVLGEYEEQFNNPKISFLSKAKFSLYCLFQDFICFVSSFGNEKMIFSSAEDVVRSGLSSVNSGLRYYVGSRKSYCAESILIDYKNFKIDVDFKRYMKVRKQVVD